MHTKNLYFSRPAACFAMLLAVSGMAKADDSGRLADMVPGDLAFAVAVPEGFRLENGDATLAVQYSAGTAKLHERISLKISRSDSFAATVDAAGEVYVGRLDRAATQQFEQFQQAVARIEETGADGSGGLSVSITGGCFSGEPMDTLPISTWVQVDASHGYIEVIKGQDLFSVLDAPTRQRLMANLRRC